MAKLGKLIVRILSTRGRLRHERILARVVIYKYIDSILAVDKSYI